MSGFAHQRLHSTASPSDFRLGHVRSSAELTALLETAIVGQADAVAAVVRALTIAGAGLADPERPLATMLLAGPTGVGKTEIVRRVAAHVRGGPDDLCRIDMNSLAQEHYSASLAGAPPGYSGAKEAFSLFQAERIEGNLSVPGIVLFDEVEKAHTTVLRALLQITDTGILRLAGGGKEISFRNCLVFMTSNLGSRETARAERSPRRRVARRLLRRHHENRWLAINRAMTSSAIRDHLDPEFYNRLDEVVIFDPLDRGSARTIATDELDRLTVDLAARGIDLRRDPTVDDHILGVGFDPVYGARNIRRTIRREVVAEVAAALLGHDTTGRVDDESTRLIRLAVRDRSIVIEADAT